MDETLNNTAPLSDALHSYKTSSSVDFSIIPNQQDEAKKAKPFLPMLHGKATDSIANMAGTIIEENRLNNTGIVDTGEVKLVIDKITDLSGTLGVSTHKLLSVAVASFTELNNTGHKERDANFTSVKIPLKEFASYCGYDVEQHTTETPEEAKAEAIRAENALKNARKKINKDLAILYSSSLSWKEKVRGKQGDYMDIRLIEAKGIKGGYIAINFSQTFSEYLVKLPITQYPVALLGVDERNNNAYTMGLKMAEHFNMDNNQRKETAQLLKVKTLLALTTLPNIEDCKRLRRPFTERIKEPFENSLDELTKKGFLKDWEYTHAKGEAMTDEEATNFSSFEEWAETLIHFTLTDAPDHTARLNARADKKKART